MKILLISLDKWGYNNFIAKDLERKGFTVVHFDIFTHKYEYPSLFHKLLNFFSKNLFSYNLKREHINKLLTLEISQLGKQDITLIMNSDNLSLKSIKRIRANTNTFITFLNDSISRYPRLKSTAKYFDTVYSFDPEDVKTHNFKLATNYIYFDYKNKSQIEPEFNIFNISSLDKRSETLPLFASYFKSQKMDYKLIAFSGEKMNGLDSSGIEQTNNIYSLERVLNMVKKSNVLLDLQRPYQKGLSFRVFEALALEKKLITTNKDIVNYDFYNATNIMIVKNVNAIAIPKIFFTTPYQKIDEDIVEKYHISSWVDAVFNLKK